MAIRNGMADRRGSDAQASPSRLKGAAPTEYAEREPNTGADQPIAKQ